MTATQDRLDGQVEFDAQSDPAVEAPHVPADPPSPDAHGRRVGGDTFVRSGHARHGSHDRHVAAEQSPHPAKGTAPAMVIAPGGASNSGGQGHPLDHQTRAAAPSPPAPAKCPAAPMDGSPVRADPDDRPAAILAAATTRHPPLADPILSVVAEQLDDIEQVRIANENRLRELTTRRIDPDGVERGWGLPADDPRVRTTAAVGIVIATAEKQAARNLERMMRQHPLKPWAKAQCGIGDKTLARLLAVIGDPYWHGRDDRPRTVAELRSYAGWGDARRQVRRRGEKANWSDTAKKRTWLIAKSCVLQLRKPCAVVDGHKYAEHVDGCCCSPYRLIYDEARRKYEDTLHDVECRRCGPKGKPAQPGSPRSPAHQEAMAYRVVCKAILKDLWREAGRLHGADVAAPMSPRETATGTAMPRVGSPSPGAGPHDTDTPEVAIRPTASKRGSPPPGADETEPPAGAARRAPGDPRRQSTAPPPDTHERTGTT